MHLDPTRATYYGGVHLFYASIVCLLVWGLTSFPRGRATAKYWIWVATTLNFVIPLGAIADRLWRAHLGWATPLVAVGDAAAFMTNGSVARLLLGLWALGAGLMAIRLCRRVRAGGSGAGDSTERPTIPMNPGFLAQGVPVRFTDGEGGPAVDGVLRPRISLPNGIDRVLNQDELTAVLMHEVAHAKRRDNLIRLVYEIALCLLWFHPLVWLAGSRLALYRELSCDEAVIQRARGRHLLAALRKLAAPEGASGILLQASASSLLTRRVAMLSANVERPDRTGSALLGLCSGALLAAGVVSTIAHTACCFVSQ